MRAARYGLWALVLALAGRVEAQAGEPAAPPAADVAVSNERPVETVPPPAVSEVDAAPSASEPAGAPAPNASATGAEVSPSSSGVAAQAPAELTDAELAALGLNAEDQGLDKDLHFSGFMDVNFGYLLNAKDAPLAVGPVGDEASFFVGRLNLYATKNITESFRMMTEVRFTYAPNGSEAAVLGAPTTNTEVRDYTGSGATMRWGGIVVERAYGEWSPWRFLSLRLGAFLTPYGIWNVDHGSPVYVPVLRPHAVNGAFFPEHQTGLEALGRFGLSTNLSVRYHLTLSNGLGPISEYRDLDSNKAVGGRLAFEYVGLGTFQVGGSAFYGTNSAGDVGFGISADGRRVILNKQLTSQADVTAVAADIQWKYKGLHLQGEWVGQRMMYTNPGRTKVSSAGQVGVPADAVAPDSFNWGGYGMVGYRLPWWGIMPFGTLEHQRSNTWGILTTTSFSQVGLNIRPADAIVVKVEYMFAFAGTAQTQLKQVAAQLAWAF